MQVERANAVAAPAIDCFYIYPSVSLDASGNSDMVAGVEEAQIAAIQFARLSQVCRTYAPLYRQRTLTSLRASLAGQKMDVNREMSYEDVRDAWRYYLRHDNGGCGFVLIGHSQGASLLTRLLSDEISGSASSAQFVSAILPGANVPVIDSDEGIASFAGFPACEASSQLGCIISYMSFLDTNPPTSASPFGIVKSGGRRNGRHGAHALCSDPVRISGKTAGLIPYLSSETPHARTSTGPAPQSGSLPVVKTPFVSVPGLLVSQCVSENGRDYLSVHVNTEVNDPRVGFLAADLILNGQRHTEFGLHLIDLQVAMGNLIEIVASQSSAYEQRPAHVAPYQ